MTTSTPAAGDLLDIPAAAAPTHAQRLAAAAAVTAAARKAIQEADDLAAEVSSLKLRAGGGDLDDTGAADLVAKAEALRLSEITLPRRKRALDDALAAEVKVGLEILSELAAALDPVEADAAQAADRLTAALVDPAAAALEEDTVLAREIGVARCSIEKGMHGVFGAWVLAERIKNASTITWGAGHVPGEAALIVASWETDVQGIKAGTALLRAALRALKK